MNEDQLEQLVAVLPDEMHFVGGPYCGFYLHPHYACVHDVHLETDEESELVPAEYRPSSWSPVAMNMVMVAGPLGSCLYLMESERAWRFHSYWSGEPEPLV